MSGTKYCSRCMSEKPVANFSRCSAHVDKLQYHCKSCDAANKALVKEYVIAAYGGKCECPYCDITEPRFLTLDHVNNDGVEGRRNGEGSGSSLWAYVLRKGCPRDRYRLLCFNCNCGRRHGDCPHVIKHNYLASVAAATGNNAQLSLPF